MVYQRVKRATLDYQTCHYGESALSFRGPRARLDVPYVAVIGGSHAYGRFVDSPYPALLEKQLGTPVVNLGVVNAGVDAFAHDASVIDLCRRAEVTVVQTMPAANMSNRLYSVHPRRNDRFIKAATLLQTVFSDVDFTDIHFTGHLILTLRTVSRDRFRIVEEEIKTAWVARMKLLLDRIRGKIVLLHGQSLSGAAAEDAGAQPTTPDLIDADMLCQLSGYVADMIHVEPSQKARQSGMEGMMYDPLDRPAACQFPNPPMHEEIAEALASKLGALL